MQNANQPAAFRKLTHAAICRHHTMSAHGAVCVRCASCSTKTPVAVRCSPSNHRVADRRSHCGQTVCHQLHSQLHAVGMMCTCLSLMQMMLQDMQLCLLQNCMGAKLYVDVCITSMQGQTDRRRRVLLQCVMPRQSITQTRPRQHSTTHWQKDGSTHTSHKKSTEARSVISNCTCTLNYAWRPNAKVCSSITQPAPACTFTSMDSQTHACPSADTLAVEMGSQRRGMSPSCTPQPRR